ncbi:MAG TPA: ABC transporter permease [Xanthomonadales bacterium]|nr:ABC transporter permease [Xanthomonadales bacterium]
MKFDPDKLTIRRIEPHSGWMPLNLKEVYEYRRLLAIFVWRDVKARYKQTMAGVTWVIIQPVLSMLVFSVFFGQWLKVSSGNIPYPVFAFCALIPWTYFVHALTVASNSVVGQQSVISKAYFPRLLLPMAAVLGGLVDLLTSMLVLVPLMLYYGLVPGPQILALPLLVLLAALTALGMGLWLAAINVRFRDVNHAMPFITQLWLFATPVAYPITVVPDALRPFYELNPMVSVVEGFRWALTGDGELPLRMMLVSGGVAMAILVSGLYWFRREEILFSDVV